jgi:hypothetical protein
MKRFSNIDFMGCMFIAMIAIIGIIGFTYTIGTANASSETNASKGHFYRYAYQDPMIYVDPTTKCQYFVFHSETITPRMRADGTQACGK